MTLPSNFALQELWYIDRGTTFNTAFTAADTFQGSATKLRVFDVDLSGLTEEVVADKAVQTAFDGHPPPIRVKRAGSFNFKMHLEGGSATTSPGAMVALLGAVLGGLKSPTAITDAVEAASTATQINATAHGMDEGQIVMVGAAGDSGGDGRTSAIADATTSADYYTLELALPAAPAEAAVIKNGHEVFVDWTDESYQDFLFEGSHVGSGATDDPDQIQAIGCSATVEFGGLGEGESPYVQFNYNVGQWQWVNYANQATIQHTTAASGGDPVDNIQGGSLQLQDAGTTTYTDIAGHELTVNLNMALQPIRKPGNPNGIGGWKKVPSEVGPEMTVQGYWANLADMPGLYNDFTGGTAKQILWQVGRNAATATHAGSATFYMRKAYAQPIDPSTRVNLEGSTAIALILRGTWGGATDLATAAKRQQDAAFIIGFN